MSKSIKMVAVVDGEEIVVGRCHPGQARLLRKNGLAVWAQDKIILTSPPPRTIEESVQMDTLEALEALAKEGKTHVIEDGGLKVTFSDEEMEGWKKHPPTWGGLPEGWYPHPIYEKLFERNNNWQGVLEEEYNEIDPEGLVGLSNSWGADMGGERKLAEEYPTEVACESLAAWGEELRTRKAEGHTLFNCDDPRARLIGFVDHTDNVYFSITLTKVKCATDVEYQIAGFTPEDLRSVDARCALVGDTTFVFNGSGDVGQGPDAELEALWMAEAEEIGAENERRKAICLPDEWANQFDEIVER